MSSFIPIAIAHDATCDKGDEWLFHGLAKDKKAPKGESNPVTKDEAEDAKTECIAYCIAFLVLMGLLGICYLIAH